MTLGVAADMVVGAGRDGAALRPDGSGAKAVVKGAVDAGADGMDIVEAAAAFAVVVVLGTETSAGAAADPRGVAGKAAATERAFGRITGATGVGATGAGRAAAIVSAAGKAASAAGVDAAEASSTGLGNVWVFATALKKDVAAGVGPVDDCCAAARSRRSLAEAFACDPVFASGTLAKTSSNIA